MNPARQPRDRHDAPDPGPIRDFHLPAVEGVDLKNGLRVRSMLRGELPLVSGTLVVDAGETRVRPDEAGLAVLTGDSLSGGTEKRSGAELAESLERLGTSLRVSTGWDATSISFTCVAERLGDTMALLAEILTSASFPDDEVERVRRQRLAAIHQRRMEPSRIADDELDRTLHPAGHPYARPLSGRTETVEALSREQARAFVDARYRPDRGGFVLVGDLSPAQVQEHAERHLGEWGGRAAPPPELPSSAVPEPRPVVVVDRPGAVQSEIRIGYPGPERGHPDETPLEVGNSILGGAFTSRLNLNLREEHGFTYGVRSNFARRRVGGAWTVRTAVQTEVTVRALEEAMKEVRAFVVEGPTAEEVERARDYLAGVFPLRMETAAQLAARVAELLIFGLPEDYHHRYRERVRAVTVDEVGAAMQRHLDADRAPIVVVGDAERVADEIDALGLGALEVRRP